MTTRHHAAFSTLALPLLVTSLLVGGCEPPAADGGEPRDRGAEVGASTLDPSVEFPDSWRFPEDEDPVISARGMVSTTDEYASRVGADILERGGNAVDAAIAVAFALAVVNPEAGNIGGGGFMVTRREDGETFALDYREKAPLAAHRDMFLDEEGELTDTSVIGHLASGVPGTVMGMWEAHQRLGSLPWDDLVQPAVELAEGIELHERLAGSLQQYRSRLEEFDSTREVFLPDGSLPALGEIFRQPDLARTLGRIRDQGADGFYRGETADLIVQEMEAGGGIITHEDLEAYTAAWRDPVTFSYRDHTVVSMTPVSSGGITMAQAAGMLEALDDDLGSLGWHSPEMIHLMAEVWKRAYADRNEYLADPDFVDVPVDDLLSPSYLAQRASEISLERAVPSEQVRAGLGETADLSYTSDGPSTTHFSIVDEEGTAVSVTTTINLSYGSRVTVRGAGFLLNNEMDDFSARPGHPNQFGLVQGENNAVEPGKRMLSSMTPTLVVDPNGELLFVTGTPGGATIITTVFQTISNVVDFGMDVVRAVNAPRVHHQHLPDRIQYENGGLRPEVVEALRALGHTVDERGGISGDVQAIMVLPDGTLAAHSDPRRGGVALGL